ncbi:Fungal-trans domain-containing protein [Fusarium sp. Ph1]|nr:Fungal-trans domain-containing protein [Fusarium sp. Ph1]
MANNWYDQQAGLSMSRLSQLSKMAYASPLQPGNVEMRPAVFDRFSPQPLTENPNPSHTTTRPANSVLRISPGLLF